MAPYDAAADERRSDEPSFLKSFGEPAHTQVIQVRLEAVTQLAEEHKQVSQVRECAKHSASERGQPVEPMLPSCSIDQSHGPRLRVIPPICLAKDRS